MSPQCGMALTLKHRPKAPTHYMNPAHRIITMFGGPGRLGRLLNLHRSTVWRWQVASDDNRNGKDGVVPAEFQQRLIDLARSELGKKLTRDAFFPTYEKVPVPREESDAMERPRAA